MNWKSQFQKIIIFSVFSQEKRIWDAGKSDSFLNHLKLSSNRRFKQHSLLPASQWQFSRENEKKSNCKSFMKECMYCMQDVSKIFFTLSKYIAVMFAINCDKVYAFSYLIGLNTQMCARFDTYISYKNWISVDPSLRRK
jgi:hypothetical protein